MYKRKAAAAPPCASRLPASAANHTMALLFSLPVLGAGWQSDWKARQCEKYSSCESCAKAPLNCVWQEKRQAALRWRDCGYHLFYTASQEACVAKCVHADAEDVGHITSTLVKTRFPGAAYPPL